MLRKNFPTRSNKRRQEALERRRNNASKYGQLLQDKEVLSKIDGGEELYQRKLKTAKSDIEALENKLKTLGT